MWPLSLWRQLFARALFVLWKEDRKYVGEILYERVCGGFLRGFTILILSSQSNPLL